MTKLSIHTELLPKRTTECREKDRERLVQKPCAFDVMKDARAARSMYQRILLRQFMKFLVSCRPFARHRGVNYPGVSSVRMMRSHAQAFTHVETRQDVTMTELSTHTELLNKGTNGALAGRLLSGALIIGFALAAALIGATFGTPQSGSIGEAVAAEAFVAMAQGQTGPFAPARGGLAPIG